MSGNIDFQSKEMQAHETQFRDAFARRIGTKDRRQRKAIYYVDGEDSPLEAVEPPVTPRVPLRFVLPVESFPGQGLRNRFKWRADVELFVGEFLPIVSWGRLAQAERRTT